MKKKLLSTVFALAMGATCAFGFTACGGDDDKDAETASKAVNYIKALYENKAEETAETYMVIGVAPVDNTNYTVNWSVAKGEGCTVNDISDYVSVGEMNDKKQVTITIEKAEVEIPYVLTASVKVGSKTEKIDFNRKVPAKASGHAGTLADPYTPSNIRDIAATMSSKWDTTASDQSKAQSYYWPNNDAPTEVYVKGYIVKTGNKIFTDYSTYVGFVYIADEYAAEKSSDDADVVMIMSISYDNNTPLKSVNDIKEGDCITVHGYIQNYFKNSTSSAQPEVSRWKDSSNTYHDVKCDAIVAAADNRTDAEKITDALAEVSATMNVTKAGDTALPTSSEDDVTFAWELKSGTAATVANNKLTVASLPSADAEVVIKVTATCGSATAQTKDVTVTIKAASTPVSGGVKFDFSSATGKGTALTDATALTLFNTAGGSETGLTAIKVTSIYDGNGQGGAYENTAGLIKTGTSKAAGQMVLTFDKEVSKIEIKCHDWYKSSTQYPTNTNNISVNGSTDQLAPYNSTGEAEVVTFDLATPATEVTIDFKNRIFIFEIVVYFAD